MRYLTSFGFWLLLLSALVPAAERASAGAQDESGRRHISTGSKWEDMAAYSRAVVDGCWVFVSGTVGFDPEDNSIPEKFDDQMDQIFRNLKFTLEKADADLRDIVRVRSYIVDQKYIVPMSDKLKQYLDDVRPANTTIITGLAATGALVELEVTALRNRECTR